MRECERCAELQQRLAAAEAGIDWEWQTQVNADLEERLVILERENDELQAQLDSAKRLLKEACDGSSRHD
jgi:hypothetical protein